MKTAVVLAGGAGRPAQGDLPPDAIVIAADGGAEHALRLGLRVDLAVGDFDSLPEPALQRLAETGARIERHPATKDMTDLELALDAALALEPDRIVVLGGAGGRLDHLFGELLLIAADAYSGVQVDAQLGAAAVHVVRRERVLTGAAGELVSLFAVHGPAEGVTTEGLLYPLAGETLAAGSSRGVSNTFMSREARVAVARGILLAVRPNGSVTGGG